MFMDSYFLATRFLLNTILVHFPRKFYLNLYDFIEPYQYHCYRLSGDINSLLQQRMDFPLTNPCMGGLRPEIGSGILTILSPPQWPIFFPLETPIKSWIIIILWTKYQIIQATWQKNGSSPMAFSWNARWLFRPWTHGNKSIRWRVS